MNQGVGEKGLQNFSKVPKGYRTYTLFLATSYGYAGLTDTAAKTAALASRFDSFGKAIGEKDLAVFVSNSSGKLDVAAGRTLLEQIAKAYGFKADEEEGPYLVVLQRHPAELPAPGQKAAVIALGRQDLPQINQTLDELEKEIRAQKGGEGRPDFNTFWLAVFNGWLSSASPVSKMSHILSP